MSDTLQAVRDLIRIWDEHVYPNNPKADSVGLVNQIRWIVQGDGAFKNNEQPEKLNGGCMADWREHDWETIFSPHHRLRNASGCIEQCQRCMVIKGELPNDHQCPL